MATGRILKKQISLSEQVNSLSLKAALLYTWMLAHADDYGRLRGSPRRVKAQVVPMRDDITAEDVAQCLREMHEAKLIIWYSVDDELYIQFPTWEQHQTGLHKRTASKYPPPPEMASTTTPEVPGISRNHSETTNAFPEIPPRTEQNRTEQEQEGKYISPSCPPGGDCVDSKPAKPEYTEDFETFWSTYPRKVGKKAAFDKWKARLRSGVTPAELIKAAEHYAIVCTRDGREQRYIMQPETFLGPNERWKDFLAPPPPPTPRVTRIPPKQRNPTGLAALMELTFDEDGGDSHDQGRGP